MRFHRYGKYEFHDTPRKRNAILRKREKVLKSYPLLSAEIKEEFENLSIDKVMEDRRIEFEKYIIAERRRWAQEWKRARKKLFSYPEPERKKLRRLWNLSFYPATGSYLLSMLINYDGGDLDADEMLTLLEEMHERRKSQDC